jgi:hypothetical protein
MSSGLVFFLGGLAGFSAPFGSCAMAGDTNNSVLRSSNVDFDELIFIKRSGLSGNAR